MTTTPRDLPLAYHCSDDGYFCDITDGACGYCGALYDRDGDPVPNLPAR